MFYQKNGQVIIRLARDIFVMEVGDRLPPIGAYAEALSMGRGTVQIALNGKAGAQRQLSHCHP